MYTIGGDCPGENIELVHAGKNTAFLRHERRAGENRIWPFWAFHADDLPDHEITFRFTDGSVGPGGKKVAQPDPAHRYDAEVVGPFGPAVSTDGLRWEWLDADGAPDRKSFKYSNTAGHKRVYFSIYLGYHAGNLDAFLDKHRKNPRLRVSTLTRSEKGAEVPLLEIGRPEAKYHVLLTARHHAGETSGSYVLEGFMEHLLRGRGFASEHFLFHAVPLMDYDGVQAGDPGNNRHPHNHNRDYGDKPLYASVRAVRALAERYDFSAALDFHGPVKWGKTHDVAHAVKVDPDFEAADVYWAIMREKFAAKNRRGQISVWHDLVFPDYNGDTMEEILANNRRMNSGYMRFVKNVPLALSLETPFCGTAATFTVTAENQRALGRRYARGLDEYCRLFAPLRLCIWKNENTVTYTGIVKTQVE